MGTASEVSRRSAGSSAKAARYMSSVTSTRQHRERRGREDLAADDGLARGGRGEQRLERLPLALARRGVDGELHAADEGEQQQQVGQHLLRKVEARARAWPRRARPPAAAARPPGGCLVRRAAACPPAGRRPPAARAAAPPWRPTAADASCRRRSRAAAGRPARQSSAKPASMRRTTSCSWRRTAPSGSSGAATTRTSWVPSHATRFGACSAPITGSSSVDSSFSTWRWVPSALMPARISGTASGITTSATTTMRRSRNASSSSLRSTTHHALTRRAPPPSRSPARRRPRGSARPVCARSSSGVPSATTRPRAITTMRSQSAATSCMTWLENSTQRPSARSSCRKRRSERVVITSRPLVGSSSSTLRGSCTSARAIAVLVRCPCENPSTRRSMKSCMPSAATRRVDPRRDARLGDAVQAPEILDVLARREPLVEAAGVRQHAEPAAHVARLRGRIDAVDQHAAGVRLHERVEHAQRRGLAGAVRAEQAGDLAVARREAHVVHGADDRAAHGERLLQSLHLDHRAPTQGPQP